MLCYYRCAACSVTGRLEVPEADRDACRRAAWAHHMEATGQGAGCGACEIAAYARGAESVWCVLLPRLIPGRVRCLALAGALEELEWEIDGSFIVDRYLATVPTTLKTLAMRVLNRHREEST